MLHWNCPFLYRSGVSIEDFTSFDTGRLRIFEDVFDFDIIWIYIPCKIFIPR